MEPDVVTIVVILVYKMVSLVAGLSLAYMGYRLFLAGISDKDGNFKEEWTNFKIALARIGPGIYFALFGTAVIIYALNKGVEYQGSEHHPFNTTQSNSLELPVKPPTKLP
jgi:hypothetical protein